MNETHGGGFYMSDDQWVRSVNNKNIYTGGQMRAGNLRSDGNVSAGGVLTQDQINTAGAACTIIGAISHDATGSTLSCVNKIWTLGSITDTVNAYGEIKCDNRSSSIAYCPNGYRLLSGGYALTEWGSDNTKRNSPDSAYPRPDINAFVVTPPGSFGGCGRAVALCGK